MRKILNLVLHCTDSPDSNVVDKRQIDIWHRARGWDGCGYHYVVRRDGVVEVGRPESKNGAHVEGHNSDSIGVVWCGREKMTDIQLGSIVSVFKDLLQRYPGATIKGHKEFPGVSKTCPNFDMDKFRQLVQK